MNQEIARRGPNFMVEFEAEIQETLSVSRYIRGNRRLRAKRTDLHKSLVNEKRGQERSKARYLEDGLHLVELGPGMFSCEHLDDQAPNAPYISLLCVRDLFDNLGGHPINRALERRTVQSIPWHEVF
jgi:hypothetical protein